MSEGRTSGSAMRHRNGTFANACRHSEWRGPLIQSSQLELKSDAYLLRNLNWSCRETQCVWDASIEFPMIFVDNVILPLVCNKDRVSLQDIFDCTPESSLMWLWFRVYGINVKIKITCEFSVGIRYPIRHASILSRIDTIRYGMYRNLQSAYWFSSDMICIILINI